MELFKGYVATKDKKCLQKFSEGAKLLSLEQANKLDEYAGILAEDTVLIDIDDEVQSDILMDIVEERQLNCRVVKTTRGKHFYFKNGGTIKQCYTGVKLACGLTADIKAGVKNSYSILKFKGEERFIEWDIEEGQEYEVVPFYLYPNKGVKDDFMSMDEGDGRNEKLYSYILSLTALGLNKEQSREVLNIINEHLFKSPLAKDELDVIARDEAFPKDLFFDKRGFHHEKFGDYLISECHVLRVGGQLVVYKDGSYYPNTRDIESAMLRLIPSLKAKQRSEVLKYIEIKAKEVNGADARYIAFRNGVLDITTGELLPLSPNFVITNAIPWDYNPSAYSELADDTLNKLACNDAQIRALLEESIGYLFYRRNQMSKSFILVGERANGKSTYLEMIKNVLGANNVSSLDLSNLEERFSVCELAGKLANIGDDISDEFMQGKSIATFKKIVSGNSIKAEFKGEDVFFFEPYVKLLFSANDIPRTKDKTGAVLRRLIIIPFNARFTENDPTYDPYIIYKLKDMSVMEYLIKIGIEGLKRVLVNNKFSEAEKVNKAVSEYELDNNPILGFINEHDKIVNEPTREVYSCYRLYCVENGFNEMTLTSFTKEINRRLNLCTKQVRTDSGRKYIFLPI